MELEAEPLKLDGAGLEAAQTAFHRLHGRNLWDGEGEAIITAYLTATRPDTGDLVSRLRDRIADNNDPSAVLYLLADALDFISRLSTAPAGDVVVKPLEWDRDVGWPRNAETPFGQYKIWAGKDVWFGTTWLRGMHAPTVEDAERWAQEDYEQRIRSALAPTPSPQTSPATEGEAVGVIVRETEDGTEVSWFEGTELPVGTHLYAALPSAKAGEAKTYEDGLRDAAELAKTFDGPGHIFAPGTDDLLPTGWAGCRRTIATAIEALSRNRP